MDAWTKVKKEVDAYIRELEETIHIVSFVSRNLTTYGNLGLV